MRSGKRKNNLLILLMLILFLSIGYAMLTTTLNINGTGKVKNAKWDVYFANIQETDGSVAPAIAANITDKTTASFEVTLEKPGDFYEFTIDVVNGGTIDAMVGSFSKTPKTVPDCVNYTVTWANGETPKAKDGLGKGKTHQMKVRVEMLKDINAGQLLTSEQTLTLSIQLNCVQATSEAQYTVPTVSVAYYAFGDPLTAEDRTTDYTTLKFLYPYEEETAKVFVKLDEDGIQKSVCTIVTGSLECFKNNNYEEEKNHMKAVFGEANCTTYTYSNGSETFKCDNPYSQNPDRVDWCEVSSGPYGKAYCRHEATQNRCDLDSAGNVECGTTP